MKKSSKIYNYMMIAFIFLTIYIPAIIPKVPIQMVLVVWAFAGIVRSGHIKVAPYIPGKGISNCLVLTAIGILYVIIISLLSGGDPTAATAYFNMLFYGIIYATYICLTARDHGLNAVDVMDWILKASVIQTVFVVLTIINNDLRTRLLTYLIDNGAGISLERFETFTQRTYGLANGYYSGLGIASGIMASMALMLGMRVSGKYYFYIPGLLLTTFVNVRTGLVVFAVGAVVVFLTSNNHMSIKSKIKFLFLAAVVYAAIRVGLIYLQKLLPDTFKWMDQLGEHTELMRSGREGDYTYYRLNPVNWIWPEGSEIIIGTGKSIFGAEGMRWFHTSNDSGYLNLIYKGGIILCIIMYSAIYQLCMGREIRSNTDYRAFGLLFIASLIVQQYKGSILYLNEYMTLIIIVVYSLILLGLKGDKNGFKER